ncbi:hypothetical protein E2562_011118 [Oryza meyeriana var. granulata]|uniref:Uncharacterized protein n=1 Tax=Oryza meyeriana var. granulata TaxID=110450 RepID=A0A6G1DGC1_9ORYZ|nr:hypothetical protein E2562_011118 [Oryza meyeriana var. granulata]
MVFTELGRRRRGKSAGTKRGLQSNSGGRVARAEAARTGDGPTDVMHGVLLDARNPGEDRAALLVTVRCTGT